MLASGHRPYAVGQVRLNSRPLRLIPARRLAAPVRACAVVNAMPDVKTGGNRSPCTGVLGHSADVLKGRSRMTSTAAPQRQPVRMRTVTKPTAVYYFATCLIDLFYPKAGLAGMQLLRRAGLDVRFPQDQTCCGQPAFNSGYRKDALAVARAQLFCLSDDLPVVVPSGSCAGMITRHWPELFNGDPDEAAARDVAGRTFELTQFLVDVLDVRFTDLGRPLKVAVHTSCAARREMGVARHIESLIGQLHAVQLLEPARATECCGFGGTFAVKQADISGAMVHAKTDALRATGAERVITQDCGCLMNIAGAFKKQGGAPQTQHIAEFLWERTQR